MAIDCGFGKTGRSIFDIAETEQGLLCHVIVRAGAEITEKLAVHPRLGNLLRQGGVRLCAPGTALPPNGVDVVIDVADSVRSPTTIRETGKAELRLLCVVRPIGEHVLSGSALSCHEVHDSVIAAQDEHMPSVIVAILLTFCEPGVMGFYMNPWVDWLRGGVLAAAAANADDLSEIRKFADDFAGCQAANSAWTGLYVHFAIGRFMSFADMAVITAELAAIAGAANKDVTQYAHADDTDTADTIITLLLKAQGPHKILSGEEKLDA